MARIDGKKWRLSRALLFEVTGELHPVAMHSCDNPPCCNLAHLTWGTKADNTQDASRKGRLNFGDANPTRRLNHLLPKGSARAGAKLTESKVREIRELVAAGQSCSVVADRFGVCSSNISMIVRRVTWTHV